ncbi:MAG: bifunctional (p)ppGpp synthetase/guanosine-3',5'-bis(diphosphate) 3'-pyrophosphohydrolase, partial [Phascolarctobacterium sp.]|nr:bifunctional (p)ppGpp synthetase/guanosine-3',5'-bis(diphosphate) 3'-pyrophosphohydrolase [Phascolarctobacterium sp.]
MGVGHMPNTSEIVTIEDFFEQAKGYLNDKQIDFVRSAYILAADAHKEQRRKSDEPYIIHPIGVASILAGLQMDEYTLAAAFLHDVVEDTEY